VEYTPAIADGVVYFGTASGSNIKSTEEYFYALDAVTGRELWKIRQPSGVAGSPAVVDGFVYIVFFGPGLFALDAGTGQEKWRFREPIGVTMFSPAVAYDTVYITSVDDRLYAIDSKTGQEKWRFQRPERFFISPVIADGVVYCLTFAGQKASGYLYAIDAQMGQERWRLFAPGSIGDTPAVADAVIYFKGEDQYLYAIR